jgi:hypothetical protein
VNDDAGRRQDLGLSVLPPDAPEPAGHNCRDGWLPDVAGRAVPCLVCKPHLSRVRIPGGRTSWKAKR